ncbi:unnamed protein product [Adineta steineri]|uniref:Uncharacterized protein n=1 Tax=Adineta steineri TaxID=433720 RepID=A0A815SQ63_9BILA|nr:unnamed protein product [Adineta steineri]CAF3709939.1 unnamed protein product [Adineta steineri]
MENEYVFNYDEIKQKFESVPQTNKIKSMAYYKTRFQPRTKSISGKNDMRTNMANRTQTQEKLTVPTLTFQVHVINVEHIMPIEHFCLQTQQRLYIMPNLIK